LGLVRTGIGPVHKGPCQNHAGGNHNQDKYERFPGFPAAIGSRWTASAARGGATAWLRIARTFLSTRALGIVILDHFIPLSGLFFFCLVFRTSRLFSFSDV
jgi:hypothetical protein